MLYYVNIIDTPTGILTVITFFKSVICIYNHYILYFSLLENYLCQLWLCKLHLNLSGNIKLNPGQNQIPAKIF